MKTLRQLVAVGLLFGSCTIGFAQSNSTPSFKSDTEKQDWIDTNEKTSEMKFQSEEEKSAWIQANPEKYKAIQIENKTGVSRANVQINTTKATSQTRTRTAAPAQAVAPASTRKADAAVIGTKSVKRTEVKRVNNTSKALPADYKPTSSESKTSEK